MVSTLTTNKGIEKPANGDYTNTWSTPMNADWDIVDTSLGGVTSLNATGASGTTVLTVTQYRPPLIKISGTLTANVTYQVPSGIGGFWFVQNATTGAFTVTLSSGGGGTSVNLPQGYNTPVTSDGTNIAIGFTQPSSVAAAGSSSQVQFNSGGTLGASSSLTWNGSTLAAPNFAGNLTGNVAGTLTGSCTGSSASCTGNAATASNLSSVLTTTLGGSGGSYANVAALLAGIGGQSAITVTTNGNGTAFGINIGGTVYYIQLVTQTVSPNTRGVYALPVNFTTTCFGYGAGGDWSSAGSSSYAQCGGTVISNTQCALWNTDDIVSNTIGLIAVGY